MSIDNRPSRDSGESPGPRYVDRPPPRPGQSGLRCRRIAAGDDAALATLFEAGFPGRSRAYWDRAIARLGQYTRAGHYPHFGYALEADGKLVGALLMIFRRVDTGGSTALRCNLSSWCVDERYRSFGSFLVNSATRDPTVTYINISPERATRPMVEAQGFSRYCDGLYVAVPLAALAGGAAVTVEDGALPPPVAAQAEDLEVMRGHGDFECLRLWLATPEQAIPLILVRTRHLRGLVAAAHVVYCPRVDLLPRFARPIGRWLARRGLFVLTVDANAPLPGLPGRYLADRMPKYFRGPDRPALGDLAFTELPMFGV